MLPHAASFFLRYKSSLTSKHSFGDLLETSGTAGRPFGNSQALSGRTTWSDLA